VGFDRLQLYILYSKMMHFESHFLAILGTTKPFMTSVALAAAADRFFMWPLRARLGRAESCPRTGGHRWVDAKWGADSQ
jgi:hypothetical protein